MTIEECECLLENGNDLATELEDLRRIPKEKEEVDKKSKENETKKGRDDLVKKDFNWTKVCRVFDLQ